MRAGGANACYGAPARAVVPRAVFQEHLQLSQSRQGRLSASVTVSSLITPPAAVKKDRSNGPLLPFGPFCYVSAMACLSVSQLNELARVSLQSCFEPEIWVQGEIQGLKYHAKSGHLYFDLVEKGPAALDEVRGKDRMCVLPQFLHQMALHARLSGGDPVRAELRHRGQAQGQGRPLREGRPLPAHRERDRPILHLRRHCQGNGNRRFKPCAPRDFSTGTRGCPSRSCR